jgi:predicted amidohydrolase YtcJ
MSLNPDVILTRGKIVTVDSRFSVAEALALRGGVIEAVGSAAEIESLAGPGTRVVDLRGRTVMPGIHDVHYQMFDRACAQYFGAHIDLPETIGDVLDALRDAARRIPIFAPDDILTQIWHKQGLPNFAKPLSLCAWAP